MKYIISFMVIGVGVLAYSLSLDPYTDENVFRSKYMNMSSDQSEEYFKLRDEMLTPKFRLQDTAITLISFSALLLVFLKLGKGKIKSPKSKSFIILLAWLLPFLTALGYIFDLIQGMVREEFPHWADSLGIPLMGVPIQFIILFVWSMLHLGFIRGIKPSSISLAHALSLKFNPWLLFVSGITFLLVIATALYGQYWYAVPGVIWVYYYLSLGIHRIEKST